MAAEGFAGYVTFRQAWRLALHRKRHPERKIEQGEFGVWHVEIPLDGTSTQYIAEHRLDDLLDHLDEMTGEQPAVPDG